MLDVGDSSLLSYLGPTPPASPVSPRSHSNVLTGHLRALLAISTDLLKRVEADPSSYGVAAAFIALEDDQRTAFEAWAADVDMIMRGLRRAESMQPQLLATPPTTPLMRSLSRHMRWHGGLAAVGTPKKSRRPTPTPLQASSRPLGPLDSKPARMPSG